MGDTKILYHIDDEDTPYLIKLSVPPDKATLGDFKLALNRSNYKYFFRSMDDDFGVVKEELVDDSALLPCYNGRVVSWLVAADGNQGSEVHSQASSASHHSDKPAERLAGIGESRPPSFHTATTTRESNVAEKLRDHEPEVASRQVYHRTTIEEHSRQRRPRKHMTSSVISSELEVTSACDTEMTNSRYSSASEATSHYSRHRQRKQRRRHRMPPISKASTISSITESSMSLNILTVTLNLDAVNFLGISIVGQMSKSGDGGGIYVGSIMKGGAVAHDGRIEPGDMILEVNGVSFENMSNDDAVRLLRDTVQKPGPVTLVVAKCWDPNPRGYFTVPHQEPVRPIDPSAWVAHTTALQHGYNGGGTLREDDSCTMSVTSSSLTSSVPPSERFETCSLTKQTELATVVKAMTQLDSGLQICDRMWLKITIPNSFIGSDLVDWLCENVQGFSDRKDARRYAAILLKHGFIKHTVNKSSFSEQCYYVMGNELADDMSSLALDEEDFESVSEVGMSDGSRPTMPPPPRAILPAPASSSLPGSRANGINSQLMSQFAEPPKMYGGHDTASYVSMPLDRSVVSSGKNDQTCNCILSHTYKQIRRLWVNGDKHYHASHRPEAVVRSQPKFNGDLDLSTSSDSSGSTVSADGQRHRSSSVGRGGGRGRHPAPLPGGSRRRVHSSSDTESSAADFYHRRAQPPMVAPLPPSRLAARPPFSHGGPLSITESKHSFRRAMESSNAVKAMGSV